MQAVKTQEELLAKACELPLTPGVYLMKDKTGKIIYVGKSRKLKNRVSQYFRNQEKNEKTARMVAAVADFDYFLCDTEIEALSLENALIKQHTPKYNIRLKDAKSYPYIKITAEEYPRLRFTRKRDADKDKYFGPFSGVSVASTVLRTLEKTLRLPKCNRQFPRDIGKERPCLYYRIGQCMGVCTGKTDPLEYRAAILLAAEILRGNTASVRRDIREKMEAAAEAELFEKAAALRDTLFSLEKLSQKQTVVAAPDVTEDVFGVYLTEGMLSLSVFYVRGGAVSDKFERIYEGADLSESDTLVSLLYDHYHGREDIPPKILLSFALDREELELLSETFSKMAGKKVTLHTPMRGELHTLCELAVSNARERAEAKMREVKKSNETLVRLADLLALEILPERIESYDISNFGKEHKTCGMIVVENGRFKKSDYRVFRIKSVEGTDDYASMEEALTRRLSHIGKENDTMSMPPDLILLDGGNTHVSVVQRVLAEQGLEIPVFGMVKDAYHKTRALCDGEDEISIATENAVFRFVYEIQEEVHRFSIKEMSRVKEKTLRTSVLEEIPGIGREKARALLLYFNGLPAIKRASIKELAKAPGIGESLAETVYEHFHRKDESKK